MHCTLDPGYVAYRCTQYVDLHALPSLFSSSSTQPLSSSVHQNYPRPFTSFARYQVPVARRSFYSVTPSPRILTLSSYPCFSTRSPSSLTFLLSVKRYLSPSCPSQFSVSSFVSSMHSRHVKKYHLSYSYAAFCCHSFTERLTITNIAMHQRSRCQSTPVSPFPFNYSCVDGIRLPNLTSTHDVSLELTLPEACEATLSSSRLPTPFAQSVGLHRTDLDWLFRDPRLAYMSA